MGKAIFSISLRFMCVFINIDSRCRRNFSSWSYMSLNGNSLCSFFIRISLTLERLLFVSNLRAFKKRLVAIMYVCRCSWSFWFCVNWNWLPIFAMVLFLPPPLPLFIHSVAKTKCDASVCNVKIFLHCTHSFSLCFFYNVLLIERRTMVTIKSLKAFFFFLSLFFPSFWRRRYIDFCSLCNKPTRNLCFACSFHLPPAYFSLFVFNLALS